MIEILFRFGGDVILVKISGNNVLFGNTAQGARMASIKGLDIKKSGVVKEFPDLKDRADWKDEAIKRFKDKIKTLKTEKEKAEYIIEDLNKWGYKPWKMKVQGRRATDIWQQKT